MKFKLIISVIAVSLTANSQPTVIPQSFENLNPVAADDKWNAHVFVGAEYDTSVSQYSITEGMFEYEYVKPVCFITVHANQADKILVGFSRGSSDDPEFHFFKFSNGSFKHLFGLGGTQVYIPGNGNIYVSGIANNMFDMKQKFSFANDTVTEVPQPFYHVGQKTHTLKTVRLFSNTDYTEVIATLPANSEIEVVLATVNDDRSEYLFLIKTSFGLLGWWKMDSYHSQEISELYFHGD